VSAQLRDRSLLGAEFVLASVAALAAQAQYRHPALHPTRGTWWLLTVIAGIHP
jgi:hypothetical protein